MHIIDAFAMTLGLDSTGFVKGQRETTASMRRTREAVVKDGAAIEKSMDKANESFDRLIRNGLKLFAILTGGRAVKDFVQDITAADAAVGRLAKSLGTTPETLTALGNAVARSGGSADAAISSFEKLADAYNEVKLTGTSAIYDMLAQMQGMTGKTIRFGKDIKETLGDIAEAAQAMAEKSGVAFTMYMMKQRGIDRDTAALLIQGREKFVEALEKSRKVGLVRKEDAEAAQKFQTSLETAKQSVESLGRAIWTALSPALTEILEKMNRWLEANGEWLRTEISEKVKILTDFVRALTPVVEKVAEAFGGWSKVLTAIFGTVLFTKLMALLRMIGLVRMGLTNGVLAALGVGGTAAVGAAVGTAIGADAAVPNAQKPGVTNYWDDEASGAAGGAGAWGAIKRGWRGVKRWFGGGSAAAGDGGAGIRARGARAARDDQSGGVAANPGAYKDFLDHVARSEGTAHRPGGGYNTSLDYGKWLPGGAETTLTGKTLDEIDALQQGMLANPENRAKYGSGNLRGSSAIGRYQIVRKTLRGLRDRLGLKGDELFDEKMQDRLGAELARGRGASPEGLRQEWASLVGAKNATAVALMQKVDPKAATLPLDKPGAPEAKPGIGRPDGSPDPTDGTGVNGDLMKVMKRAQEISTVRFHIHEGLRTIERQAEMVKRNWSRTMSSKHLTGRAIDVRADGDPGVGKLDNKKYEEINRAMKKASDELGVPIQWGGDSFGKFKDVPHFQLPDGYKSNAAPYGSDPAKTSARDHLRAGALAAMQTSRMAELAAARNTWSTSHSPQDNRSYRDTRFNGDFHFHGVQDAKGMMAELKAASKGGSAFAAAADYGKA